MCSHHAKKNEAAAQKIPAAQQLRKQKGTITTQSYNEVDKVYGIVYNTL